jgi:hypothetical protein
MLISSDRWIYFFIEYELYGDFIHVSSDEFSWLHLQLHKYVHKVTNVTNGIIWIFQNILSKKYFLFFNHPIKTLKLCHMVV